MQIFAIFFDCRKISPKLLNPLTSNRRPREGLGGPAAIHNPMDKTFYVYILASTRYGTLYIGMTSDLIKRVWEHREGVVDGFTKEHGVKHLVWYETHADAISAITREKQIKKWNRAWKINLIQRENPYWQDLYESIAT